MRYLVFERAAVQRMRMADNGATGRSSLRGGLQQRLERASRAGDLELFLLWSLSPFLKDL